MKIIYGLILLDIIVLIHELGHFFAAKKCGVTVECFSIGMGPVLLHHTFRGVDWRLSLFPVGGYCGMKGESDFQTAYEQGLPAVKGDADSLYGVRPLFRAIIGAAGPFANLVFAFIAYVIIAMTGYTYYAAGPQIQLADEVYPELHSAARDSGLKSGDTITSINGKTVSDFSDIYEIAATHPDEDISVTVMRSGKEMKFTIHSDLDKSTGAGKIGVVSIPESTAKREAKRYSFFPALGHGFTETCSTVALTVKSISVLFKGVKVTDAVSGPVRITTMLGDTVSDGFSAGFRDGLVSVLEFIALISISLFLMNLLPVPILDGGLVLFSLIEAIFRTEISPRVKHFVQYFGLAFIILLFVIAAAGDIHYFVGLHHAK